MTCVKSVLLKSKERVREALKIVRCAKRVIVDMSNAKVPMSDVASETRGFLSNIYCGPNEITRKYRNVQFERKLRMVALKPAFESRAGRRKPGRLCALRKALFEQLKIG